MKQLIFISILFLLTANFLAAQPAPYRVVFDMTSNDTINHQLLMRWANEIINASPDAKVEVVFYGKSLNMVAKDKSTMANAIMKLAENKNVALRVCEVALKNNHVEKSQLISGVGTVPDGIYEIISKQHEGWGYIKVSH